MSRLHFLDGLRGWAALSVLANHTAYCFGGAWSNTWWGHLLSIFTDGRAAVTLFFCVSGFAISRIPPESALRFCLARYPRLAIPAACATCFSWLVQPTHSVLEFLLFNASTGFFLFFSSIAPSYVANSGVSQIPWYTPDWNITPGRSHGVVLWTMYYEMQGSFLVILYTLALPHLERPRLLKALVTVALFVTQTHLFYFMLGIWFSETYTVPRRRVWLYFLGFISLHYLNHFQQIWLADVYALHKLLYEIIQSLRCVLLFACIQPESSLQLFMQNRVSQWVGSLSFPIYLLHSWARDFSQLVNPTHNEGVLFAQTLLLALPVAQAFTHVDGWAIRKSKDVAAYFIKPTNCIV